MLELVDVHKFYDDTEALKGVNLSIDQGEFVTLVGHSGSGKSTAFKLILGEEEPSEGAVFKNGKDVAIMNDSELIDHRRKTGAIFQNFRLLNSKTVYENIAFAMEALGFRDKKIAGDVPYVLDLVDLRDKIWAFPGELSGGQKQRVAIARAIINNPELILADEPTGNLDPVNTFEVINILKQISKMGSTVILATHDRQVVDNIGGRTITLSDGEVAMDSPVGKYIL